MVVDLRGVTTVLLPGTGSDGNYVHRAFFRPLQTIGALLVTPSPEPDRLIDG
ncbi:MAG: alpha/beta hydrolase, partial [Mycobacterium sp.]